MNSPTIKYQSNKMSISEKQYYVVSPNMAFMPSFFSKKMRIHYESKKKLMALNSLEFTAIGSIAQTQRHRKLNMG